MILHIHALDTITIYSHADQRRENVTFYRNLLGLPLIPSECAVDILVFKLHQRQLRIEFGLGPDANGFTFRAKFEVDDLHSTYNRLVGLGYDVEFHLGSSVATQRVYVVDPNGYRMELFRVWPLA